MSRSNSTENPNPAKRFYEWNGDSGGFRYFDKARGDKGERVAVALPFRFIVLDTLSTIKGFDDTTQSGFWSNEIRDIKKNTLTVRNKSGIVARGLYEQVITDRNCTGAKYCQSVYVAMSMDDGSLDICNVQMKGAALGAWIDFRKKNKIFEGAILVDGQVEGKKGKTVYQVPVFKPVPITQNENDIALDLDKQLQAYLNIYLAKNGEEIAAAHVEEKAVVDPVVDHPVDSGQPLQGKEDDLPF